MKKLLFLLVCAFVAPVLQAQSNDRDLYSIMYHDRTGFFYNANTSLQQRDGDHVIDTYLGERIGNNQSVLLGRLSFKVSSNLPYAIIDSLLVEDAPLNYTFLARDPQGEGNIRAVIDYREDCDSSFVRISHFPDDDLHNNPDEDVVVPLCEGTAWSIWDDALLDNWGDLILTYFKPVSEDNSDQYIARIGLDGTLKQQALLIEDHESDVGPLRLLNGSPLRFCQWRYLSSLYGYNLPVEVIDSTFTKNTVTLNRILNRVLVAPHPYDTTLNVYEYEYFNINWMTEMIPAGGNDVLVAAQYTHDTNFYALTQDIGVAVAKYDLSTQRLKGYAVFNDLHWYGSIGYPLGIKMLNDGTVYFIYKEHGYPEESVNIVKMDANLNVEWKRFCKTWNINVIPQFYTSIVFDDEMGEEKGVAWLGSAYKDGNYDNYGIVYLMLNHDGTVNASDDHIEIRPYACYPNPAHDALRLQYSPDATPTLIELYDLQGRLVRLQRNGWETVDMEGLAAGVYTMRITLEDGNVFSEKVVKE